MRVGIVRFKGVSRKMRTRFTLVFLAATTAIILTVLVLETSRQPMFRAADHADMRECVASIPSQWLRGSLEHGAAESACYYIHVRDRATPAEPSTPPP